MSLASLKGDLMKCATMGRTVSGVKRCALMATGPGGTKKYSTAKRRKRTAKTSRLASRGGKARSKPRKKSKKHSRKGKR